MSDNKRTIFVCNLLASNSYKNIPFKLKGDCADDDFINYDILYTPILISNNDYETLIYKFIEKLIAKQTSICVSLLIVGYLYRNNLGEACKFLVDHLPPSLKGNTTIYNFDASNRLDLPFQMDNIKYKRVINKSMQRSSASTYFKNSKVMFSRVEDGGFLDCEAWFNRYLATVFDCAKARLLQRSGTCYINAVINGFLLDKTFRNMFKFFSIMDTENVKKPLIPAIKNVLSGRDEQYFKKHFNLSKYIFQILYTCICKKQTFFTADNFEADFLIDYEKAIWKDIDHQATKMFNLLISSFPVEINNKIILANYHNLFIGDTFLKTVKIKDTYYSLTFALIHIRFGKSHTDNHFVTGYICNGVPKVYDSNGLFYNFDWISGKNLHLFAKELTYNYKIAVRTIIIAPIYVENELKKSFDNFEMTDDQFCNLIR